jgi:hypothetical protein
LAPITLVVMSTSLLHVPAFALGGERLARSMPRFHAEYHLGHELEDLCLRLETTLSEGSNLLSDSWQLIEAACGASDRWTLANFEGICRRPDNETRREYLRSYFPSYRPDGEHYLLLEREPPTGDHAECFTTVLAFLGATGVVPVIEGKPGGWFVEQVVRVERGRQGLESDPSR